MSDLDAVVFDLDDTLAVHDQPLQGVLAEAFEHAGVAPLFDATHVDSVDVAALPTAHSDREFHELLFGAAAERAGSDPADEVLTDVATAFLDDADRTAVSFRAGAREALAAARERHAVGLVTNGGEATQTAKLEALGVEDAFDARVFCDPTGGVEPKPDPTALRMVLDDLGVPPERALKVGDSLATDVAGARRAGMRSAWVPVGPVASDPEPSPTYALESMDAVPDVL